MELVNLKTMQPEDVSHDDVGSKFLSGSHGFKKGAPVHLVDPEGNVGEYVADDVHDAVTKGGYSFPTAKDVHEYEMKEKYGDRPLASFGLGAADTATFGMASRGLVKSGLASPEALKEIPERNPVSNLAGTAAGVIVPTLLTPEAEIVNAAKAAFSMAEATGDAAKIAEAAANLSKAKTALGVADVLNPVSGVSKMGASAAEAAAWAPREATLAQKLGSAATSGAARGALEGAAYTAGNINREEAIGELTNMTPAEMSGHILGELGFGTVLGGGLGAVLEPVATAASMAKTKLFPGGIFSEAVKDASAERIIQNEGIQDAISKYPTAAPTSTEEMLKQAESLRVPEAEPMISKKRLLEIQASNPDLMHANELQLQSLDNPVAKDKYSAFLEKGTEEGIAARKLEAAQKARAMQLLTDEIHNLAPGAQLTEDEVAGGRKAVKAFQNQYETEKKELAPIFKEFDGAAVNPVEHPAVITGKLEEAVPGVTKYLDFDTKNGAVTLAKYDPGMPFSKNVYGAMKDVVSSINKEGVTLGEVRNLRNTIADRINLLSAPRDKMQINNLKKSLMDYIADEIHSINPELNVKDTFKRYAINEQKREIIESIFGGKIGDNVSFAKKIVPEDVLKHLFGDSVTVGAARDILSQGDFNEAAANYLKSQIGKVTDTSKNGFSSAKFSTFLKSKTPELVEAFKDSPNKVQRFRDLTDFMRILPDSPSANPSGTAKTAYHLFGSNLVNTITHPGESFKSFVESLKERGVGEKEKAIINEMLKGMSPDAAEHKVNERVTAYNAAEKLHKILEKAQERLTSKARQAIAPLEDIHKKAVGPATVRVIEEIKRESNERYRDKVEEFNKITKKISVMAQNPSHALDEVHGATGDLYHIAPKTAEGIQLSLANGIQFLNSKIPQRPTNAVFPEEQNPTPSEMAGFFKFYDAVNKPLSVMDGLKTNNVSVHGIEALQAVYPDLYNAMRTEVISQIADTKARPSYQKRLALSQFLGQDVTNNLNPVTIASNQASFTMQKNGMGQRNEDSVKTTSKALGNINMSNRSQTPMEQAAARTENREVNS